MFIVNVQEYNASVDPPSPTEGYTVGPFDTVDDAFRWCEQAVADKYYEEIDVNIRKVNATTTLRKDYSVTLDWSVLIK